ncbi:hypothetical protein [Halosimplex pelagicum]|jgi:hypothetical protein|uniref:Uncharacterized protein n=1 Tax=Halosimplex pelagicum TaxID=869886 RepID=A0A7D5TUA5_9EURY|nr:hypothetical protein [Halosimplex pelagicum]QLH82154.1 hypothetical protein HZS54_11300 [Halosimplex pelagicum]
MPDCDYCESHIDDSDEDVEQAYLTHLAEEHIDEVSSVDERKLEKKWDGDLDKMREDNYRFKPITIGASAAALVFIIGLGAVAVMGGSSAGGDTGGDGGTEWVYEHGQMSVEVGGEQVPASELDGTKYFYVENETGTWRMNVPTDYRYTVRDALYGLSLVNDSEPPATISGKYTKNLTNPEIAVTVDGEPVDLNQTVENGQNITVSVEEAE